MLEAIGDGARLGLTGIDGPDLVVLKPQGKGVNTLCWSIPGNRLIFYHYASSHVVLWLGLLPWAREMDCRRPNATWRASTFILLMPDRGYNEPRHFEPALICINVSLLKSRFG